MWRLRERRFAGFAKGPEDGDSAQHPRKSSRGSRKDGRSPMPTVVDASCLSAMLFNEVVPPVMADFLDSLHAVEIAVPALWFWEVANSAAVATRRARVSHVEAVDQLRELHRLRIELDEDSLHHAWTVTIDLAARYNLTVYDAAYLELALRRQLPLATLDKALAKAARAEGVEMIGG